MSIVLTTVNQSLDSFSNFKVLLILDTALQKLLRFLVLC
jgi:hypothetical protein